MTRRSFLQQSSTALAAAVAATYIPTTFAAEPKPRRVGLIGTGWYGKSDIFRLMQIAPVEIVSLCDVDQRLLNDCADTAQKKNKSGNRPRIYTDYTKMLAEKDLEIVEIATPDHWHALPMIAACQAGADIYCQKPIGVDVVEGQAMVAAARKYGRVVQIGTQRRSTPHLIEAKERFVDSGALGKIISVDISCYWHMRNGDTLASAPDTAPPDYLDYDRWVGPAPFRPYNKIVHPRGWRAYMEYGNGIVGDMCVHMFDMTRWMMDLGWPKSVSSSGGILIDKQSKANITDTQDATFDYDDVKVCWQHRTWGAVAPGFAFRIAVVVRGIGGNSVPIGGNTFECCPHLPPAVNKPRKVVPAAFGRRPSCFLRVKLREIDLRTGLAWKVLDVTELGATGGEGGIRTRGRLLTFARFPGV